MSRFPSQQTRASAFKMFLLLTLSLLILSALTRNIPAAEPSFESFDRKARGGERLNVVFFGASLTWGANASDPLLTSYRALIGEKLTEKYPQAHFRFWDGAIGGTGSQLGLFRVNRDVLRHKPDLVFVDFSANDDINSATPETLASYEAILRRILLEAECPIVQVIFPFKWNVGAGSTKDMKRRDAHLAISQAYNTPVGDAISLAIERVKAGSTSLERIWPVDGVHPCDEGYRLFADAAWTALDGAIQSQRVCKVPEKMLYADTYMTSSRVRLSSLEKLPAGWRVGMPNLVSAYFDFLMSRWLDDEVIVSNRRQQPGENGKPVLVPQTFEPLSVKFRGGTVLLFGETTKKCGKYRVIMDGQEVPNIQDKKPTPEFDAGTFANRIGGNGHYVQVLATGLDLTIDHTLEIIPVFSPDQEQELRFESLCIAGGDAKVLP